MEKYSAEMRACFIQDWKASGKSLLVFCGERGISKNTFQYWLKRERRKQTVDAGFVEIGGVSGPSIFLSEVRIEIGKLKIILSGEKNTGDLEALIKFLWTLEC